MVKNKRNRKVSKRKVAHSKKVPRVKAEKVELKILTVKRIPSVNYPSRVVISRIAEVMNNG